MLYFKNGTDNFVNTFKVFHIMIWFFMALFWEVVTLEFKEASASRKIVKSFVPLVVLIPFLLDSLIIRGDINSQV